MPNPGPSGTMTRPSTNGGRFRTKCLIKGDGRRQYSTKSPSEPPAKRRLAFRQVLNGLKENSQGSSVSDTPGRGAHERASVGVQEGRARRVLPELPRKKERDQEEPRPGAVQKTLRDRRPLPLAIVILSFRDRAQNVQTPDALQASEPTTSCDSQSVRREGGS